MQDNGIVEALKKAFLHGDTNLLFCDSSNITRCRFKNTDFNNVPRSDY